VLLTGRALMGAGFGVMLIGSMVVISRWFPPDRFSTMAAMVLSIGLLGNLLATTPLAWGTELIGWRGVFGIVVVFCRARHRRGLAGRARRAARAIRSTRARSRSPGELLRGLGEVLRNPRLPFILVLNFCNYACTFTVQGLWGGPFLREVHGLTIIQSGNVPAGRRGRLPDAACWLSGRSTGCSTPASGSPIGGTSVIALVLGLMALAKGAPAWTAVAAIVAIGFFSASSTMIMTHGRAIFPDRLIGRGMSTMNTCVMLGVACMQSLSGVILGAFEPLADGARSELAYRTLFGFMAVVLVVAVAFYSRVLDVRPSDELSAALKQKEKAT
jgi:MFS family permease